MQRLRRLYWVWFVFPKRALFAIPGLLCACASVAGAQQLESTIQVIPSSAKVIVEGERAPVRVWSFRDSYAGVVGLGNRIERMTLFDDHGLEVTARKIAPGQFESARPASRFRYEVNLTPPTQASDASRVSWLNSEHGLLMLADLLPVPESAENKDPRQNSAIIRFKTPAFCAVYSNEEEQPQGEFLIADIDRGVFVVGTHLRTSHASVSNMRLGLVTDGEWAFGDQDALEMASQVLKAHRDVFGVMPAKDATLILFPFPESVSGNRWSAETRGTTVTLLMGKLPTKNSALAALSVPLTHELFHFWVPNTLALTPDYEWFYEGFTIYQAARTSVRLGLLTFQEFLNAIGRAYDAYAVVPDRDRWSLLEASRRRWAGGEAVIYQKAMLIALLYDLNLRSESHGKRSLDDVYRELFRQGQRSAPQTDGNEAVINALNRVAGMNSFTESHVRRAAAVDLPAELAPFGLQVERLGQRSRVSINDQLSRQQRDLLRQLGYNDYRR